MRAAASAGQSYPAEVEILYREVHRLMTEAPALGLRKTRAILVPHAGYLYSGAVAAASYREVQPDFRRVFLLAANHNRELNFAGVSLPEGTHFAVPGGEVPLSATLDELQADPMFACQPAAHSLHMLEVQLPFLCYLKGGPERADFTIVPMILGRLDRAEVERLAAILDGYVDEQTLFVFSVDLSHYYPEAEARKLDQISIEAMMSQDPNNLGRATTDGNHVLLTMLELAERRGWETNFLAYRNSGEMSGDRAHVVGYASVVCSEPFTLTAEEERALLAYGRRVIEVYLREEKTLDAEPELLERHPVFRLPRAVFVTLRKKGQLRGCMGDLVPSKPLHAGVQRCAIEAATGDPRFAPLSASELSRVDLSISILSFPRKMKADRPEDYLKMLQPGVDGVILFYAGRQSTFLPSVWKEIVDAEEFLSRLSRKQGAPADAWRDPEAILYRYGALEISEEPD